MLEGHRHPYWRKGVTEDLGLKLEKLRLGDLGSVKK